jgi:hypothetical protein
MISIRLRNPTPMWVRVTGYNWVRATGYNGAPVVVPVR